MYRGFLNTGNSHVFDCLSLIFWYSSISLGKCFESSSNKSDLKFYKKISEGRNMDMTVAIGL